MRIGIDIDGVLIDDDTYRLDTMTKYCFENNLPGLQNPYKYEAKCNWSSNIEEDYRKKYFFEYMYRRYQGTEMELYFCWNSRKECFASNSELLALRALLMYGVNENIVYAAQTFEKLQRYIELYQDLLFDVYTKCKKK